MPVITRIVQGKKNPERVNVFVDGRFSFSLSLEESLTRHLKSGLEVPESVLSELKGKGESEKLFAKLINFISYRPRSAKEVKDRMYKYLGAGEQDLKNTMLAKLEQLGYIDDLAFAKWFVESRRANRPRSRRHLASELAAKGIPPDVVRQTLQGDSGEKDAIRALIAKKKGLKSDKLAQYLARRGFSWELIKEELS